MNNKFKEEVKEAIKNNSCGRLSCEECRKETKSEEHNISTVCFRNHLQEFKNIVK